MRRALLACALVLAACGSHDDHAPPPPEDRPVGPPPKPVPTRRPTTDTAPSSPAAEARHLFAERCSTCHGPQGRGDGVASSAMNPPPRDYADAAWQASVTDADLAAIILGGGAAVGKSPMMPASKDLEGKPEVVAELIKLIRGFGAP
jgi:mono/diheme cytochrome c family protein